MKKPEECLIHIIEDDDKSRKFLVTLLSRIGFQILEAELGLVALDQLEKENKVPDIFLVDAMMPNLDGFELIRKIRALEQFKDTPIIMTTALDDVKHIKESITVGANAYVVKPINVSRLKEKIKDFLDVELP